jgi:hypothetical protein
MKKKVLISFMICSIAFFVTSCVISTDRNGTHIRMFPGHNNLIALSGYKKIAGNGVFEEKERGVMDFDAIDVRGSVDVIISEQKDASVKVSGDGNLIDFVETYVKSGVLNVHFKDGYEYKSRNRLRVTVPGNGHINSIKTSGASDVIIEGCLTADHISVSGKGSTDVKGNIKAEDCKLSFSGSSDYKGNIEAVSCKINCSGSSDCIISGSADVCDISMSGSSDFKGYDFVVKKFSSSASGSSDVQITCTEELRVKASGSSDVYYKGPARVISVHTSGSSSLHLK